MAIVFDAITPGTGNAAAPGGSPFTISGHTVAAGSDRCLFAFVSIDCTTDENPTVTWNSVAMTLIGEVVGSATTEHVAAFRLVAPDTGNHPLAVTWDIDASSETIGAAVASYTGVDQTTPVDGVVTDSGSDTTMSSVVTSATGDLVLDVAGINANPTVSIGGGHTQRANFNAPSSVSGAAGGEMVCVGEAPGAASVTMSWTWSGAQRAAQVAFNVNAAAGPATGQQFSWHFG